MTELEILAARLDQALTKLEQSPAAEPAPGDGNSDAMIALQVENERLNKELSDLKRARVKDLAELDTLIAQLRPLVEESA